MTTTQLSLPDTRSLATPVQTFTILGTGLS